MSTSSRWRDTLGRLGDRLGLRRRSKGIKSPKSRSPRLEQFEQRLLLSISPRIAGAPQVDEGSLYTLQLSAEAASQSVTQWTIDWGDGQTTTGSRADAWGEAIVQNADGTWTATHVYADDGVRLVTAVAYDDQESPEATLPRQPQIVSVQDVAPVLSLAAHQPLETESNVYSLILSASDLGDNAIGGWTIDWGDGTTSTGLRPEESFTGDWEASGEWAGDLVFEPEASLGAAASASQYNWGDNVIQITEDRWVVSHAYATSGTYAVTASATNEDGTFAAYGSASTLDTHFGDGGAVQLDFGEEWSAEARGIAVQPDGKIVVVGDVRDGTALRLAVARFNADGTPDTTFFDDGTTTLKLPDGWSGAGDVAIQMVDLQPRIVVAGFCGDGLSGGKGGVVLVRYWQSTRTGQWELDPSFKIAEADSDGVVRLAAEAVGELRQDAGLTLEILSDSELTVAGQGQDAEGRAQVATVHLEFAERAWGLQTSVAAGKLEDLDAEAAAERGAARSLAEADELLARRLARASDWTKEGPALSDLLAGGCLVATDAAGGTLVAASVTVDGRETITLARLYGEGKALKLEVPEAAAAKTATMGSTQSQAAASEDTDVEDTDSDEVGRVTLLAAAVSGSSKSLAVSEEASVAEVGGYTLLSTATMGTSGGLVISGETDVDEGEEYSLTIDATGLSGVTVTELEIDWGDGTTSTGSAPASGTDWGDGITDNEDGTWTATHAYADDAQCRVDVTAYDASENAYGVVPAAGELDTRFGASGTGWVIENFGYTNIDFYGMAMAVQPDGKILVAGYGNGNFAMVRYNADGTLDTGFGTSGRVITNLGGTDICRGIALQSDGKIILVGECGSDVAVVRYTANGQLDNNAQTGFGDDHSGKVIHSFSAGADRALCVTVLPDDSLIVGGMAEIGTIGDSVYQYDALFAKFTADGVLDTSFGSSGALTFSSTTQYGTTGAVYDTAYAVEVLWEQEDEIILAAALCYNNNNGLCFFNDSGEVLDEYGGGDGVVEVPVGYGSDWAHDLVIDRGATDAEGDDTIVLAGYAYGGSAVGTDFSLVRCEFDATGDCVLDTSFDADGKMWFDYDGLYDYANAVALLPNGQIVTGGSASIGTAGAYDFALSCHDGSDGALDTDFGTGGQATLDYDGGVDKCMDIAVDEEGNLLVAGLIYTGGRYRFALARVLSSESGLDVTVHDVAPTLGFSGQTQIDEGDPYALDITVTDPGDDVISTLSIDWGDGTEVTATAPEAGEDPPDWAAGETLDWGDGVVQTGAQTWTATHVYDDGSYAIQVEGLDEDGNEPWSYYPLIPGDANGSGTVDELDASILSAHWQQTSGATWADGDFNGDGAVNELDASILSAHWDENLNNSDGYLVVDNVAPVTTISDVLSDYDGGIGGLTCGVTLSVADPGEDTIASWTIDWGDGAGPLTIERPEEPSSWDWEQGAWDWGAEGCSLVQINETTWIASYTYAAEGQYMVTATPADEDGSWPAFGAAGTLDTSFGEDGTGWVIENFGYTNIDFYGMATAVQPDGKILVAGYGNGNFAMVRYNADGTLDTGFGMSGRVITNLGGTDICRGIALQSDGKIILVGECGSDFAVVRYTANGQLDTTFGTSGKVIHSFSAGADRALCVTVLPDDSLIVGGMAEIGTIGDSVYQYDALFAKFTADGVLDTSFGSSGALTFSSTTQYGTTGAVYDTAYAVEVLWEQEDEIILAAALCYNNNNGLCFFNDSGEVLDEYGGGDGVVEVPVGYGSDWAHDLVIDRGATDAEGDDTIVLAGYAYGGSAVGTDFSLVRCEFDATGDCVLDTSFDADGKMWFDYDGLYDYANAVALLPNGQIVTGGSASIGTAGAYDFALSCHDGSDGALDTDFGTGGQATLDYDGGVDKCMDIAVDEEGNLLVAGLIYTGGRYRFALARLYSTNPGYKVIVSEEEVYEGGYAEYAVSPEAELTGDSTIEDGQTYTLVIEVPEDTDSEDCPAWWTISWGDGTFSMGGSENAWGPDVVQVDANTWQATHIYADRGQYTIHVTPLRADANFDGVVDDLDASIFASHWQQPSGATWLDGDFTGDGAVNDLDASILAAHWQAASSLVGSHTVSVYGNAAPQANTDLFSVHRLGVLVFTAADLLANDLDWDGDSLQVVSVTSPATGTLAGPDSDGQYTYDPDDGSEGIVALTYEVTDGIVTQPVTGTISVEVYDNAPTTVYSAGEGPRFTTDRNVSLAIPAGALLAGASDADPEDTTFEVVLVGTGTTVHGSVQVSSDGVFVYTPASGYVGTDTFQYRVSNNKQSEIVTASIKVVNTAPVGTADYWTFAHADTNEYASTGSILDNDYDFNGDVLSLTLDYGPRHGSVALNDNGTFTFTANEDFAGIDTFAYTVSDGCSQSATVVVTIEITNTAPSSWDAWYRVIHDRTLLIDLTGSLRDLETEDLSVTVVSDVANGTCSETTTGVFMYTPDAGFVGQDSFAFRVADDFDTSGSYLVTIDVVNNEPVAVADVLTTQKDTVLEDVLTAALANDLDFDGDTLAASLVTQPSRGSLTQQSDGTWDYTPTSGFVGTDSFTYAIGDGAASAYGTVFIEVTGTNTNSTVELWAGADYYRMSHDTTLTVGTSDGVLANDFHSEGKWLNASLISNPTQGTLAFDSDGSFTYTPTSSTWVGTDTFTYRATDGVNNTSAVTVTIVVGNTLPSASHAALEVSHRTNSLDQHLGDYVTDPDGDNLTFSLVSQSESGGSVSLKSNGTFNFSPASGFAGVFHFTYSASDGVGSSNPATVTIDVTNERPWGTSQQFSVHQGTQLQIDVAELLQSAGDSDSDTLSVKIIGQPPDSMAEYGNSPMSGGTILYTPVSGYVGMDSFAYVIWDGLEESLPLVATIQVDNTAPEAFDTTVSLHPTEISLDTGFLGTFDVWDADSEDSLLIRDGAGNELEGSFQIQGTAGYITVDPSTRTFVYRRSGTSSLPDEETFSFTVFDGAECSAPATLTLHFENAKPVATDRVFPLHLSEKEVLSAFGEIIDDYAWDPDLEDYRIDAEGLRTSNLAISGGSIGTREGQYGDLTLDSAGTFCYTLHLGLTEGGTDEFVYTVTDGNATSDEYKLIFVSTNAAPTATDRTVHFSQSSSCSYTFDLCEGGYVADRDESSISGLEFSTQNLPSEVSVTTAGAVTVTTASTFFGTLSFDYRVSDGYAASDWATVDVIIENRAPVAQPDHYVVQSGGSLTVPFYAGDDSLTENDLDPEGTVLTVEIVGALPNGITRNSNPVDPRSDSFSFDAPEDFSGVVTFSYKVKDAGGAESDVVAVVIECLGSAPVGAGTGIQVHEDSSGLNLGLTLVPSGGQDTSWDIDAESGEGLTVVIEGNLPSGIVCSEGVYSVSDSASPGDIVIRYRLKDAQGNVSDLLETTISVTADLSFAPSDNAAKCGTVAIGESSVLHDSGSGLNLVDNVAPEVSTVGSFRTWCGSTFTSTSADASLLSNVVDINGDSLTVSPKTDPSTGTVTVTGDGHFTYTPSGYSLGSSPTTYLGQTIGTATFEYYVSDGQGHTVTATGLVELYNTTPTVVKNYCEKYLGLTFPLATEQTIIVGDLPTAGSLFSDADIDKGDSLSYSGLSATGGTLSYSDGEFRLTLPEGFVVPDVGYVTLTATATDEAGYSVQGSWRVYFDQSMPLDRADDATACWFENNTSNEGTLMLSYANVWLLNNQQATKEVTGTYGTLTLVSDSGRAAFNYVLGTGNESSFINAGGESFVYAVIVNDAITSSATITVTPTILEPGGSQYSVTYSTAGVVNGIEVLSDGLESVSNGVQDIAIWFDSDGGTVHVVPSPATGARASFGFAVDGIQVQLTDTWKFASLDLRLLATQYLDLTIGDSSNGGDLDLLCTSDIRGDITARNISINATGCDLSGSMVAQKNVFFVYGDNVTSVSAGGYIGSIGATGYIGTVTAAEGIDQVVLDYAGSSEEDPRTIGNVTAGGSIGRVWALASNTPLTSDIAGDISAGGDIGYYRLLPDPGCGSDDFGVRGIKTNGDICGSVTAAGHISNVESGGDITGNVTAQSGTIYRVHADESLMGNVQAELSIGLVETNTGELSGSITSTHGSIGRIATTTGFISSSSITAGQSIGSISASGTNSSGVSLAVSGGITATNGYIGDVTALGKVILGGNGIKAKQSVGTLLSGSYGGFTTMPGGLTGSVVSTTGLIERIEVRDGAIDCDEITAARQIGAVTTNVSSSSYVGTIDANITGKGVAYVYAQNGNLTGSIEATGDNQVKGSIGIVKATLNVGSTINSAGSITCVSAGELGASSFDSNNHFGSITGDITACGSIGYIDARGTENTEYDFLTDSDFLAYINALTQWWNSLEWPFDLTTIPTPATLVVQYAEADDGDIRGQITSEGSIGSVRADGNIAADITAYGRLPIVWALGNIAGSLTSGFGTMDVTSLKKITGNIIAAGAIRAESVSGHGEEDSAAVVTSTGSVAHVSSWGDVNVDVAAEVTSVYTLGDLAGSLRSRTGSISLVGYELTAIIDSAEDLFATVMGVMDIHNGQDGQCGVTVAGSGTTFLAGGILDGVALYFGGEVLAYSLDNVAADFTSASEEVTLRTWGSYTGSIDAGKTVTVVARESVNALISSSNGNVSVEAMDVEGTFSTNVGTGGSIGVVAWGSINATVQANKNASIGAAGPAAGDYRAGELMSVMVLDDEMLSETHTKGNDVSAKIAGGVVEVASFGSVTGDIRAEHKAKVFAYGNVSGNVTVLPSGFNNSPFADLDAEITSWGTVSGKVEAGRNANVFADLGITGDVAAGGTATLFSYGNIACNVVAGCPQGRVTTVDHGEADALISTHGTFTGNVTAIRHVAVDAFGTVRGNMSSSTGNVLIAASDTVNSNVGSSFSGNVTARLDVGITVAGDITGQIDSGRDAVLTAHGNVTGVNVKRATSSLKVSADASISGLTVDNTGDVAIGAIADVGVTSIKARGDVRVISHAGATLPNVVAGGEISVRTLEALAGGAMLDGRLGVSVRSFGTIPGLTATSAAGPVIIECSNAVTAKVEAAGRVSVLAIGALTGDYFTSSGDDVVLQSLDSVTLTNGAAGATAFGSVSVRAATSVTADVTAQNGSASVVATSSAGETTPPPKDNNSVSGAVTAQRDVYVGALGGAVDAQITATKGNAIVEANGSVQQTVTAGNRVTVVAMANVAPTATITGGGDVEVTALDTVSANVASQHGGAAVVAGVLLKGQVSAVRTAVAECLTGNVTESVTSSAGSVYVLSGGGVTGAVSAAVSAAVDALDSITGTVTATAGTLRAAARGGDDGLAGDITATLTAGTNAYVYAYGDLSEEVHAGCDAVLWIMGDVGKAISAGRDIDLVAYGSVSSESELTAGRDICAGAFGDVDADLEAGGSVMLTAWSDLTSTIEATSGFAGLWVSGDASVNVEAGQFVSLLTYGSATLSEGPGIDAGTDAMVWSVHNVSGSITAGRDAGVVALNKGTESQTAALSIEAGRDIGIWTLGNLSCAALASGSDIWAVALGTMSLETATAASNLVVASFDQMTLTAATATGGHAQAATYGSLNASSLQGAKSAYAWAYGTLSGAIASAQGPVAAITFGGGNLTVNADTDAFVASVASLNVVLTAGDYATVFAGTDVSGTVTTQSGSVALISLGDISLDTVAAGRDLWAVAIGNIDMILGCHAGRDLGMTAYDSITITGSAGCTADRDILFLSAPGTPNLGTGISGMFSAGRDILSVESHGDLDATLVANGDISSVYGHGDIDADIAAGEDGSGDLVLVKAHGDITGNFSAGDSVLSVLGYDDIDSLTISTTNGSIDEVTSYGDLDNVTLDSAGEVGTVRSYGAMDVQIEAADDILLVESYDEMLATLSSGGNVGTVQSFGETTDVEITAAQDIGLVKSYDDLNADLAAGRDVAWVTTYGNLTATVAAGGTTAGDIGRVTAYGNLEGAFSAQSGGAIDVVEVGGDISSTATFSPTPNSTAEGVTFPTPPTAPTPPPAPDVPSAEAVPTEPATELAQIVAEVAAARAALQATINGYMVDDTDPALDGIVVQLRSAHTTACDALDTSITNEKNDAKDEAIARSVELGGELADARNALEADFQQARTAARGEDAQLREEDARERASADEEKEQDTAAGEAAALQAHNAAEAARAGVPDQRAEVLAAVKKDLQEYLDKRTTQANWVNRYGDMTLQWILNTLNAKKRLKDKYDRLRQVYDQAKAADATDASACEQTFAVWFYDATGAMGLYQAFTGEDPVTLEKYSNSERFFRGVQGALELASLVLAGASALHALRGPCGGLLFNRCFVAGTEVVVGEAGPGATRIDAGAGWTTPEGPGGISPALGATCLLAAAGVVLDDRRRRRLQKGQEAEAEARQRAIDALFHADDLLEPDAPEPEDALCQASRFSPADQQSARDRVLAAQPAGNPGVLGGLNRSTIRDPWPPRGAGFSVLDRPALVREPPWRNRRGEGVRPPAPLATEAAGVREPGRAAGRSRVGRILAAVLLGVAGLVLIAPGLLPSGGPAADSRAVSLAVAEPAAEPVGYATEKIENLRIGDVVLAADPATGRVERRRIVDVFCRMAYRLRVLTLRGPDGAALPPIRTTDEHPFWVVEAGDFVPAGALQPGQTLLGPDGQRQTLAATRAEDHPEGVPVYNFEVEGAHTYYVLSGQPDALHGPPVLVHNAIGGDCALPGGEGRAPSSGGRLGSASTRAQVADIQAELRSRGWTVTNGGALGEEYIRGPGGARLGSAYPDITAVKNGQTLRINTIDTLSDGLTPTAREAANAAKIRRLTGEHLLLVPKP